MKTLLFSMKPPLPTVTVSFLLFANCFLSCKDESVQKNTILSPDPVPASTNTVKATETPSLSQQVTSVNLITPPGLTRLDHDSLKVYEVYETRCCSNADCSESTLISRVIIPKKKKLKQAP